MFPVQNVTYDPGRTALIIYNVRPILRRIRARSSAVEHLTFNQRVSGSIPDGLTNLSRT